MKQTPGGNGDCRVSDLVLHGDRIEGHVDAFDWSERSERLSDGVFSQLVIDGADVYSTHDGEGSLTLSSDLSTSARGGGGVNQPLATTVITIPKLTH